MRKKDELAPNTSTCMNNAHPEEMVFTLLGRDPAAPVAIRAWVAERIRLGKNKETDEKIVSALECARVMEVEGDKWKEKQKLDMWEHHDRAIGFDSTTQGG